MTKKKKKNVFIHAYIYIELLYDNKASGSGLL